MVKSGAGRVSMMSQSGSRIQAMAVWHTSRRLNPQMLLAMPTAMPVLAETSTFGKVVGSRVGSSIVAS